jgi:hypothetical protein
MDREHPHIPNAVVGALLASGFPFQTAVANVIGNARGWTIVAEEFPWQDDGGADQFLDIIATSGSIVVTLECKKTQKETLTFLRPANSGNGVRRVRALYTSQIQDSTRRIELFCSDWYFAPESVESAFCVVSTSSSGKDQRLLERDAQLLVRGTDAYAQDVRRAFQPGPAPEPDRPYLPLIVTNAPLFVATYDPTEVSLETGQFRSPPAGISPVQWVRFAKALTSAGGRDLGVRTVVVVNATAIVEFLTSLERVEPGACQRAKAHLPPR